MRDKAEQRQDVAARFAFIRDKAVFGAAALAVNACAVGALALYPQWRTRAVIRKAVGKYAGTRVFDASAALPPQYLLHAYEDAGVTAAILRPFLDAGSADEPPPAPKLQIAAWRSAVRAAEPWSGSTVAMQIDEDPEAPKVTALATSAFAVDTIYELELAEARDHVQMMASRVGRDGHVVIAGACEPRWGALRSLVPLSERVFGASTWRHDPLAWGEAARQLSLVDHTWSLCGTHCVAVYRVGSL